MGEEWKFLEVIYLVLECNLQLVRLLVYREYLLTRSWITQIDFFFGYVSQRETVH